MDARTMETILRKQSSNDFIDRAGIGCAVGLSRKQIDRRLAEAAIDPLPHTCPQRFYIPHVAVAICTYKRRKKS